MSDKEAICDLIEDYQRAIELYVQEYGRVPSKFSKRIARLHLRLLKENDHEQKRID